MSKFVSKTTVTIPVSELINALAATVQHFNELKEVQSESHSTFFIYSVLKKLVPAEELEQFEVELHNHMYADFYVEEEENSKTE